MNKSKNRILNACFVFFLGFEILLLTHWLDAWIFQTFSHLTSRLYQVNWPMRLQSGIGVSLLFGVVAYLFLLFFINHGVQTVRDWPIWRRPGQFFARFPEPPGPHPLLGWTRMDALAFLLFLVGGIVLFFGMLRGPFPNIHLSGDGANLASFAAGLDHPNLFSRDELLSDLRNLSSYSTLNVYLTRWLTPWTGSYALSAILPVLVVVPINLVGFYLLGLVLFRRRFWAFLLAWGLAIPLEMNMGETWGITLEPVTRFYFQALIPYVLVLMLTWRNQPRRWIWLAGLIGLMAFVHPVSTPAWAAAIWLGFVVCVPAAWPWPKKVGVVAGLAFVTLVALVPYTLKYFGASPSAGGLSSSTVTTIVNGYFPANLLNVPAILGELGAILWRTGLLPVNLLAGISLICLPTRDRVPQKLALAWFAGIFFAAAIVPWLEHTLEAAFNIAPIQTEMVRGLRYTIFFLVLFPVWALAEWQRRMADLHWKQAVAALGVALWIAWGGMASLNVVFPAQLVSCLQQGRLVCGTPDDGDRLVDQVAQLTPPGAALYSTFADEDRLNHSLPIRYQALRSLVFCNKDRGQLVTAHSPVAETWLARINDLQEIGQGSPEEKMASHLRLAREWGADYLITDLKLPSTWLASHDIEVLYQNDTYALYRPR